MAVTDGRALVRAAVASLSALLLAERERWPLWLPAGVGLGVVTYFLLPAEPPAWAGAVALGAALVGAWVERRRRPVMLAVLAAATVPLGFAVAQLRTHLVDAPVLERRLGPATVTGRVAETHPLPEGGLRLVLEDVVIDDPAEGTMPARVRITVRAESDPIPPPGRRVEARAVLSPPPAPAAPGAFDFARWAYFERLSAVGYALGPVHELPPEAGEGFSWRLALDGLRHRVATRVMAALEGPEGPVAAALLTGERGAIPRSVFTAIRSAGLAHLLAISGLHLGLVAGFVFFAVRGGLALWERVALRYPIKKWAAAAALIAALGYLFLSGATVPTQRAFLMAGLVLVAVMLDRTAVSMRLVAWAAAMVLLVAPESLLGPSFQMSFAAVIALVAVWESVRYDLLPAWWREANWFRRRLIYLVGVGLTTLVASAATAPFVVYHFNRVAIYGLAANFLAVPITALWIMPWGLVALLLMPIGLEALALVPMGWGIAGVIGIAETVSAWPSAVLLFPAMPGLALGAVALGGLWLCLWQRPWRWLGLVAVAGGLMTVPLGRGADVLVDGNGKLFAVRTASGELALSSRRAARFTGEIWLRREGQDEAAPWPDDDGDDPRLRCDSLGCIYRARGQVVALVRDARALMDDCRIATVVVSLEPVRGRCPSARVVIDRFDLWREGAHALWLDPDGVRTVSVAESRGRRPWVLDRGWDR